MKELLPVESTTEWEAATTDAVAPFAIVDSSIPLIRDTKLVAPPPSFLPYLIYEYGLGELTPYVPNLYDLITEGIDWQRLRGTPSAMALALGWLGYTAVIEEESTTRRFWNLFQLELDRVRDTVADLDRIAGVAGLSVPIRSKFWRGFHGLDIRPLTYSESSYSNAHYGEYSGVRINGTGPLWSFGRSYEFDLVADKAGLISAEAWIEPVDTSVADFEIFELAFEQAAVSFGEDASNDSDLGWGDFAWNSTEATWGSASSDARAEAMATALLSRPTWFVFFNAASQVIGYRRARAAHFVNPTFGGPYTVQGGAFTPQATVATQIYFEAQTGFGEGDGSVATSVGLVFDAAPTNTATPGRQWLLPSQISGGTDPAFVQATNIPFNESTRERVKFLLRL